MSTTYLHNPASLYKVIITHTHGNGTLCLTFTLTNSTVDVNIIDNVTNSTVDVNIVDNVTNSIVDVNIIDNVN